MAPFVAGVTFRPGGNRTADVSRLAGVGLGLETLQQGLATPCLLLTAAGPSHEMTVATAHARREGGEIGS